MRRIRALRDESEIGVERKVERQQRRGTGMRGRTKVRRWRRAHREQGVGCKDHFLKDCVPKDTGVERSNLRQGHLKDRQAYAPLIKMGRRASKTRGADVEKDGQKAWGNGSGAVTSGLDSIPDRLVGQGAQSEYKTLLGQKRLSKITLPSMVEHPHIKPSGNSTVPCL